MPRNEDFHKLHNLQQTLDLHVCCSQCCEWKTGITLSLIKLSHQCSRNILLARQKDKNKQWKLVGPRPEFPVPEKYVVCSHYTEERGCTKHKNKCTYARSKEEAEVWNFMKTESCEHLSLIKLITSSLTSLNEQDGLKEILFRFQGAFVELCETCFCESPQKISTKVSDTCASKHKWSPVLVFRSKDKNKRVVYDEIRPLPKRTFQHWRLCRYVDNEKPCGQKSQGCLFAHSEIEMAVWRSESRKSLDRPSLVRAAQMLQTQEQKQQHYCHVCKCQFLEYEDFMNHCFSVEHRKLIFDDSTSKWRYRDPPLTSKALRMCRRLETCEYGSICIRAHSEEELKEWKDRRKAAPKKQAALDQGLLSYQDCLLKEYREIENKDVIMKEFLPGVSVSCDSDLRISVRQENISHQWKFKITSRSALHVVALLRHERGATFALGENCHEERSYSSGVWFQIPETSNNIVYKITVSFTCDRPGVYEQWLVFDFDMRPVLLQKLKVSVGMVDRSQQCSQPERKQGNKETQQGSNSSIGKMESENTQQSEQHPVIWHEGTVEIVPYLMRSEADNDLLKKYSYTERKEFGTVMIGADLINQQNYKKKMHSFLCQEEMAQAQLVRRLNLQGTMSFKQQLFDDWSGLKISEELFGSISVSYSLAPDTPEGYMLKRHVQSVLVDLIRPDCAPQRVYEAVILKDVIGESQLNVNLSRDCCNELQLQSDTSAEMEVQFQLDRKWFCEMHKAVDMLPDLRRVLPDLRDMRHVQVPVSNKSCPSELNEKQQAAMDFILGASDRRGSVAPLLIYGPFGTGKTLTLAKITLALVQQPQNRILICTHTNSSADLYVSDHFHNSALTSDRPVRPLRIKAKESSPRATDDVTLQYCHLSKDCRYFEFPDRETLDAARIIITTTGMARYFHDRQLPSNYFSHIFIDEASQMLECEALMAIGLAGEKTQVILAGDHMQMGPKIFSVGVDKSSDHTLLNRLFHHYQAENTTTAKNSRIIFNENYRSTQEIVDFVSKHFYVGKTDGIIAKGNVPAHPHQNALQFYHVRGECYLDKRSMSCCNPDEIQIVVNLVFKLLTEWPNEWQPKDLASVCVLSQGSQVIEIRNEFKKYNLNAVSVENVENVQGKQYRVIIITTVHTKDSLNVTERPCLEFFNDVRLLNTAMTRAQSQVIVVGDATALCCPYFGKCWRLWKSYINYCSETGSAFAANEFTLDNLNQELMEISNIVQAKRDDSDDNDSESITSEVSDIDEDPILKELLDEKNDIQIKLTEDGQFPVLQTDSFENNVVRHNKASTPPGPQPLLVKQNHKTCKLIMDRYDHGFAMPIDEPSLKIEIKGKNNVRQSMTGDHVIVEILSSETSPPTGKVIEVVKQENLLREFVCTIDCNDDQVMTPLSICIPKIYTPFWKDKPNHIALKNPETDRVEKFIKINEEARRNLFVVKLLRWGRHFHHPLGIVVKELPRVTTLEKGLEVLRCEYNLNKTVPASVQREVENLVHTPPSLNDNKDFRKLMTFTIDPSTSEDLDDAISVRDLGEHYEIGVHIADVASFVAKGSELDKFAQQQETTFYVSQANPAHMFPKDLMANVFSLFPGYDRLCISLMTEVDKQTHKIQKTRFCKSVICSENKLSYEDAEELLRASGNTRSFDTLKGCLAIACDFAEVHRKDRKQNDWCYRSPDEDEVVGSRRSHKLVEELMIMFNHTVADTLLLDSKTRGLAPLRCQDRPDRYLLHDFQEKHFASLSMSIHLSSEVHGQLSMMQQNQNTENEVSSFDSGHFPILTSVFKNLEIAETEKDIHRIVDLITTDDLHPQLLPVALDLRRLIHKAQVLRASSSHLSRIGHYDLQLDCYTWASSPIRRYIDVIVQRLLLSILDNTEVKYTPQDIDMCCVEFSQKNKDQTVCDTKSHALTLASQLSTQNVRKMAYVVEVNPTGNIFRISFPLNKKSIRETVGIMYRDLQLADQPLHNETNDCMKLKWERRVYSFTNLSLHNELKKRANSLTTLVPNGHWKSLVASIREENWNLMFELIRQIKTSKDLRTKTQISVTASKTETCHSEGEHYTELSLELKKGEIIKVQLGTDTNRGLMVPAVQLLIVNPKFEICIEHSRNPILCFSKYALHSTKTSYNTYMDYQKIWKPLCEMESASSAVAENESIVLEDVTLRWKPFHVKDLLQGSFCLPLEKKIKWAIEGNLKNCFICIRLRIHQKDLGSNLKNSSTESPHLDLTSLPGLIWIAHGIVTDVSDEEKSKEKDFMKIKFRVNHKPMTEIPQCVFRESARFTLELIQKLLPDVRKEAAIDNLTKANSLVKAIATGQNRRDKGSKIHPCQLARFEIGNLQVHELNNSQCSAIREALTNDFTLIQGPPGTGKTVVGVHIVYWFFQENQKLSPLDKSVEKGPKKRCILYCGPSNKSVDVVAGQLLQIEHKLKPLRVYSEQMEILEFPYPGSNLRLSRHSKREKPNQHLRHITLHHKIRMPDNPYSSQILAVDSKIQRCQQLSDEEIKNYKDCLKKAREYELMKHDVILCTCTAASNPALADVLIQQIIIDECAMATEPEAFIPLVTHRPKQIVLLGDHKQLQPVVKCELLQRLGMQKSLFERYMAKALMLDTQYRMQKDICEFPSQEFYEGRLKTGTRRRQSVFRIRLHVPTSIIFGHVEGKEESLVVATERGNENSKANRQEANEVVRIAMSLIRAKIKEMDIAILTPYNAQVQKIKDILLEKDIKNITVNTIMKSQGSEWRYVILTTVRSCPKAAIEKEPTKSWLLKKLGFVIDPHQVNVGITRAQEGLCIIGNRDLLQCNKLWRKLLKHYEDKGCVVDPAENIHIARF